MLSFGGTALSSISDSDLRNLIIQARDALDNLLAENNAYQGIDPRADREDVRRGSIGIGEDLPDEGNLTPFGTGRRS